ncbi:MAG: T9SS type A sorting domain-containing protein [Sphingobacteriales bacterium JAD_PAG50586_3]|nr:MAG: T9SS type A sorting domain-containing protein [Sphingobacteriales bacterium JAD_PAG50586_3]
MKKSILLLVALMLVMTITKAQTTAMQFSGEDCNGNAVDLFADLDAGKAVILHFYMPNCGSCPPPAQKIQVMANNINMMHPGKVKGYAFPYQNSTTCAYSASWVSSNNLATLYAAMDSGAAHVAHYGGFGMPTVVVLGGTDHRVLFSTLSFSTSDTTAMRDSIMALIEGTTGINDLSSTVTSFNVFPNPTSDIVSITLDLKQASDVVIEVMDMSGKQVAIIRDENRNGIVTKQFSTSALPNGNYFVRLQIDGKTATQKLTVNH